MNDHVALSCLPSRASGALSALKKMRQSDAEDGEPYEIRHGMSGGVAIIEADGALGRDCADWYGCIDYDELAEAVEAADSDDRVKVIVLQLDSPGGYTIGNQECAERIAAVNKPLIVWTPGLLCSAAYFIAAGADAIVAAPSSVVGNIGTYVVFYDESQLLADVGIKVEVIASGELKAAGFPGTSLTDAQRAHIENGIKEEFGAFFGHVVTNRPEVDLTLADGREVSGRSAQDVGLIDGTALTLEDVIEEWVPMFA